MTIIMRVALFAGCLFVALLAFLELGRWWGKKQLQRDPEGARAGTTAVEGAVFALLGLLIAFTFSGAAMAESKTRSPLHVVGFAVIMAVSAYLILDLEFPRFGLIRVDTADQLLVDVRASFD